MNDSKFLNESKEMAKRFELHVAQLHQTVKTSYLDKDGFCVESFPSGEVYRLESVACVAPLKTVAASLFVSG